MFISVLFVAALCCLAEFGVGHLLCEFDRC